ncbi:hypothetical protein SO694_00181029 [Aureococcus anophagefferens]|uniref:Rab-GAP TBC domain-containing protein n=1 Tax=Aureococcus anophagefferens TaxID=44056 RepID=A0ABR1FGC9_AURAN
MSEYADVVTRARKGKAGEALVALGEKEKEDDDGSSMLTKYLTKIKILMGLYQIIGSTQWSLPQGRRESFVVKQQRNSMILQAQEQMRLAEVQAALLEHRDKASGEAVAHVSFLVEEYEPRCYLFSVFECVRRIALTGGLTIFSDGGAQIAMGLLIAMLSHGEVAQTQLVFIFFGSLLLYIEANTDGERGYANDLFGAC